METNIITLSSAYAPAALKQAMSGNVKVLMVSVLVLIVVIAGYLLLRRRR